MFNILKNFLFKKRKILFFKRGFTIIELIVVIAIIAVLSAIVVTNVSSTMEKAKVSTAGNVQRAMTKAVLMYYSDMGFYPPDVNRGWDPGLARSTPWNPDGRASGSYATSGADCSHCPSNWQDIVATNWHGPYLANWPVLTPWSGLYDYNYWPSNKERPPCLMNPGIYMGVEKYYDDSSGSVPNSAEAKMEQYGFDTDCINNNEAQMLLQTLQ
jgi:prepilin-type N-terminal cleavage/methylation domain-containing protein